VTLSAVIDKRSVTQILFSRKREVDIYPSVHGGQAITYAAKRSRRGVGYLSAMLCKACVVALKGDVIGITRLKQPGVVMVRSRSQSLTEFHHCYMFERKVWLPKGNLTYHLGLLTLTEAILNKERSGDLLDALEELLSHSQSVLLEDSKYKELLLHLSDELYYWSKWQDGMANPETGRLDHFEVMDVTSPPEVTFEDSIDPAIFTDLGKLKAYRGKSEEVLPIAAVEPQPLKSRFKGALLGEMVESLDLGLNCLLVGPTATGKSLCASEAFERTKIKKPVFIIEGHESLKEFDLLGGYTPDGSGGFTWHDGVLTEAMKAGGYLFIDEANRMPTRTLNVLLGVLSRGAVVLTEHGSEEVKAQNGFQVIMAMNLGKGYSVNILDTALLNRFNVVLEFHYLSSQDEENLLVTETGIDPTIARCMVKVANETRRLKRGKELSGEITPRGLFAWAAKFRARKADTLPLLKASAKVTWMHQVAGTDADGYLREDISNMLLDLIEAHTPK
jgi:nitric oxide reductase NorQ protein